MELLWLILIWILALYIIRLNLELFAYKKYFSQHNDIYVPSYEELVSTNSLINRALEVLITAFRKGINISGGKILPDYKKKLIPGSIYVKETVNG